MKIVFMGTAGFAVAALKALHAAGHDIALVVCQPDRPKGRGHQLQAPELKVAALELGLEVFQPEKVKAPEAVQKIVDAAPDVLAVVAYGQMLPQAVLNAPRLMPLNLHASLLPKYRGAAPIEWAIAMGESETGVCVQKMALKMDAGDVLMSSSLQLTPDDDAASVTPRLSAMGAELLVRAVEAVGKGTAVLMPQDESAATFAPLLNKSHGTADYALSADELFNRFRAFKLRPGFSTALGAEVLKITRLSRGSGQGQPGSLLGISPRGFEVACKSGSVFLEEIQSPGSKPMPAADWARGHKVEPGAQFTAPAY